MRRYDLVSGILFILSIIGFALAAPVLVQEKRQACVDVVHIPVLGKRVDEELEGLAEEYFKSTRKPVESSDSDSSDAHITLSLAPPGSDHGSTSVVQATAPDKASSTADPDPLMEASGSSSTAPMQGDDELHGPLHTPTSTEHGLDHELTGAPAPQPNPKKRPLTNSGPDSDWNYLLNQDYPRPPTRRPALPKEFGQVKHVPVQQPKPGPSTGSDFDWKYWAPWRNHEDPPPPRPAVSPKEFGQAHENQVKQVQQPNPGPSTGSGFDWKYWAPWRNHEDPPPPRPASPKEFGQAHENQAEHVQQPNSELSTDSESRGSDWKYLMGEWARILKGP